MLFGEAAYVRVDQRDLLAEHRGEVDEALRLYREAQELMPDEVEPYLALAGEMIRRQGAAA